MGHSRGFKWVNYSLSLTTEMFSISHDNSKLSKIVTVGIMGIYFEGWHLLTKVEPNGLSMKHPDVGRSLSHVLESWGSLANKKIGEEMKMLLKSQST